MMERKKIQLTLKYMRGNDKPEKGYFESIVVRPKYLNELFIFVEDREEYDYEKDRAVKLPGQQINLMGSKRAIAEFGKYLIALSEFNTLDNDYHDHFDELGHLIDKEQSEITIYHPNRVERQMLSLDNNNSSEKPED
jgi:hypothetical protein